MSTSEQFQQNHHLQQGKVIDTCAMEVGARLVAMDQNGKINQLKNTALKIRGWALLLRPRRRDQRGCNKDPNFLRCSATRFFKIDEANSRLRCEIFATT